MKNILIISLFLSLFFLSACVKEIKKPTTPKSPSSQACTLEAKICPDGSAVGRTETNCEFAPCPIVATSTELTVPTKVNYTNEQYGFKLNLMSDWENYSVSSSTIEYGFKVIVRHPQWTKNAPYEDIPILIYPIEKWTEWEANNFENYPTAAPFGPQERGRNNLYVFATAPRYNYDYQTGFEEVENIIKGMTTINISSKK